MNENITIQQERLTADEYIDFLKRTDLGSQYPQERFDRAYTKQGIGKKLMKTAHEIGRCDAV